MDDKQHVYYSDLDRLVEKIVSNLPQQYKAVYGVPRGGVVPAMMVAQKLGVPLLDHLTDVTEGLLSPVLIVDDIIDSGKTREKYAKYDFAALYSKIQTNAVFAEKTSAWVVFPWEVEADSDETIENNIVRLLTYIGEDANREGLKDTPRRVIKSYKELFSGYGKDPKQVLERVFTSDYDQMVVLKDIEFYSFCEHHMIPFFGKVTIAYIPQGKVVGISKLARLVEVYARRLQIQEQMTDQIAHAVQDALHPLGVAVTIEAKHLCMVARGVNKQNSIMTTTQVLGAFRDDASTKQEYLHILER